MTLHRLLLRQLKKLRLDQDNRPLEFEQWQSLLNYISSSYDEYDNDIYLHEQAMQISSNEFLSLNNHLENAQHIGRMGYWSYNREQDRFYLSKELYNLLGLTNSDIIPNFEYFNNIIHPSDCEVLEQCIKDALNHENERRETEIRLRHLDGHYTWYNVICYLNSTTAQDDIKNLSGIVYDISQHKQAQEEISKLHEQLMNSARQAGMAEVAVSILHNVGNILNSANVSIGLLKESIAKPYNDKFVAVADLLKLHRDDLTTYLTEDSKGKIIPEYMITLSNLIHQEHEICKLETQNIHDYIEHIKEIVVLQLGMHKTVNVIEHVKFPDVIHKSLQLCGLNFDQLGITIKIDYAKELILDCNRTHLMQILVNLIKNAKEAIMTSNNNLTKLITINYTMHNDETNDNESRLIIKIKDSGIGIDRENLVKIFSFGFTTKPQGHGYGLHDCALKAKEMKGSLEVDSEGLGFGTTFTLNLPLSYKVDL